MAVVAPAAHELRTVQRRAMWALAGAAISCASRSSACRVAFRTGRRSADT